MLVPGAPDVPMQVLDCSADAHWRQVHWSSEMNRREGTQPLGECDDLPALTARAHSHRAKVDGSVEAQLVLGWVDTSAHVGDRVGQIVGRGIDLMADDEATSAVMAVTHDLDTQTTTLKIRG